MLATSRNQIGRALPLIIATLVVGVGAYFVCVSALDELQDSQAEYVAKSFGKYLMHEVPDLTGIVSGRVASGEPAEVLGTIKPIGTVFKFRIYDQNGDLKVDSSPFAAGHVVNPKNSFQDVTAQGVASTGRSNFVLQHGDGEVLPLYYSEVMVPLMAGDRRIGAISVLSDQTESWPDLLDQLRLIFFQVIALVAIAFGVPVILYLRKHAQVEFAQRHLRHSAEHDELTGVLNRAGFARALAKQVDLAGTSSASVAVHMIDLDRFKDINEIGGHSLGDEVLKHVSAEIGKVVANRGQVARLGADEFAVLQFLTPGVAHEAADLADGVARAIARPFALGNTAIKAEASIGYADYPGGGRTADDLLRAADIALQHAKRHSRGHAVSFDRSMDAQRQTRRRIEARLRTALAENGFELYYQPIFEVSTSQLRGFEALLRLNDDEGRPISPVDFIPVAEEVGLIDEIGMWVLHEACGAAVQWPDQLFVAVNLSPAQFSSGGMPLKVRDAIKASGLRPQRLELEVTESLLITDTKKVLHELSAIRAQGPTLALDDFGTGYSSLSYLWRFPFDKLKVDRSFMADVTVPDSKSREILATIVALGKVLNLTITAEGVETEAQAEVLRELKCDLVQGYLFGRPQRSTDVAATILKAFGTSARPVDPVEARAPAAVRRA